MASETYTNELAILKLGHAVWDPNPNGLYKRVHVGDVGYFQDGFFVPLFNILLPAHDPSHQKWGVPDDHEPLMLPDHAVRKKSPLVPGAYHSESVQELSVSGSIECHQGNAELSFSFNKEKGAVLVLPNIAHREEALYRKKFKDHMLAHYRSWFSFAVGQCGCEIEISDLILVTGCDITKDWAMAAFCNSNSRASGSMGAQVPGFEAKFSLSAGWTTSRFVHHHWGPIREKGLGIEEDEDAEPDQCVFVRGYRVKEKFWGPKVLKAGAGPHDFRNKRPDDDEDLKGASSDEDVESLSESTQPVNLLLPLLDYMLEESQATTVIAHDEDIWPYIERDADPTIVREKLKLGSLPVKLEGKFGLLERDHGVDDFCEAEADRPGFAPAIGADIPLQNKKSSLPRMFKPTSNSFNSKTSSPPNISKLSKQLKINRPMTPKLTSKALPLSTPLRQIPSLQAPTMSSNSPHSKAPSPPNMSKLKNQLESNRPMAPKLMSKALPPSTPLQQMPSSQASTMSSNSPYSKALSPPNMSKLKNQLESNRPMAPKLMSKALPPSTPLQQIPSSQAFTMPSNSLYSKAPSPSNMSMLSKQLESNRLMAPKLMSKALPPSTPLQQIPSSQASTMSSNSPHSKTSSPPNMSKLSKKLESNRLTAPKLTSKALPPSTPLQQKPSSQASAISSNSPHSKTSSPPNMFKPSKKLESNRLTTPKLTSVALPSQISPMSEKSSASSSLVRSSLPCGRSETAQQGLDYLKRESTTGRHMAQLLNDDLYKSAKSMEVMPLKTTPGKVGTMSLSWPLTNYAIRSDSGTPPLYFDIAFNAVRANRGSYSSPLSREEYDTPVSPWAFVPKMTIICPGFEQWPIIIRRSRGLRCVDVFRAIYDTFAGPLTTKELEHIGDVYINQCERAYRQRCADSPGLTLYNERCGMRRVDLLRGRRIFKGLVEDPNGGPHWILEFEDLWNSLPESSTVTISPFIPRSITLPSMRQHTISSFIPQSITLSSVRQHTIPPFIPQSITSPSVHQHTISYLAQGAASGRYQ